jgi:hypothetical protein
MSVMELGSAKAFDGRAARRWAFAYRARTIEKLGGDTSREIAEIASQKWPGSVKIPAIENQIQC